MEIKVAKIEQTFVSDRVSDIPTTVQREVCKDQIKTLIKPGMKIAITAGSRGISNMALIIKEIGKQVKTLGADAFIVPAMGSHGGATAAGQVDVLHALGVTEEYCEMPICSDMDVVELGKTSEGIPVYQDKLTNTTADGVILVNRIKSHTDFHGSYESGLVKMAAIGHGNHKQAQTIHTYGVHGIRDIMPTVGQFVIEKGNVLFGIGIVENGYDQTAIIEAIPQNEIVKREKELLEKAKAYMPKLPTDKIDILFVDEIGKNYSGTGMDTNIIGRLRILGETDDFKPDIKYIIAADLSDASHGNALGIGLADLTTSRLFDKIDFKTMNENVITSSFLDRAKIPIVLDNDKQAMEAALRGSWGIPKDKIRFMRIKNTLHIEQVIVSESILEEIKNLEGIKVIENLHPLTYNVEDNLE
ncbi:lactate racemase domain-containing protein [Aquibacillus salsiterrae]|uniref:Nickel-dependent lactate racemase n=1 Tax=Aquibacillus salsiterrae TaxID=2950439 RepID=A0A9X3WF12_9BACI|nr:lactate racemase domain-containing protein [Aquibacillus salsiterrae]MDC3416224.1 nickel-dependent lactate racemase [Aquibacillus salsiterrae]